MRLQGARFRDTSQQIHKQWQADPARAFPTVGNAAGIAAPASLTGDAASCSANSTPSPSPSPTNSQSVTVSFPRPLIAARISAADKDGRGAPAAPGKHCERIFIGRGRRFSFRV